MTQTRTSSNLNLTYDKVRNVNLQIGTLPELALILKTLLWSWWKTDDSGRLLHQQKPVADVMMTIMMMIMIKVWLIKYCAIGLTVCGVHDCPVAMTKQHMQCSMRETPSV